jgi:GGDEF domain-containing protein
MELIQYIRIILSSLWMIIPITLLSFSTAMIFSYSQTPIYSAESTYVTQLTQGISNDAIFAIDTLTGRDRIFVTYCEIFRSEAVRVRAFELMGMSPDPAQIPDFNKYVTTCSPLPTSSVILLVTQGPSPEFITQLNQAIGLAGIEASGPLYGTFKLVPLDATRLEPQPISPSHSRDAVLGMALGVIVSVTLAIMLDYLKSPQEKIENQAIRDALLNVYNDRYFRQRFIEEVRRARARQRPLSIALTRLVPTVDFELLPGNVQENLKRQAAQFLNESIDDGDLLAYDRRSDLFQLILPETNNTEARETLVKLHNQIQLRSFRINDYIANFTLDSGMVESSGENLDQDRMIQKTNKAVFKAQQLPNSALIYLRDAPNPFVDENGAEAAEEYIEVRLQRRENSVTQEIDAILSADNVGYTQTSNADGEIDQDAFDRLFGSKPSDSGKDKNERLSPSTTE